MSLNKKNNLSVIILLYKTPRHLIKNLEVYKDYNVYILDQSNDEFTKSLIIKILPKISYYKISNKNLGFGRAINYLAKKVKTKYFLCTQIDVVINQKSLDKLTDTFEYKKDCIISVPKILNYKNYSSNKKSNNNIIKINQMIGAIFVSKTLLFKKMGGFDINYFFYWEDIDLSLRINKSKYNIYLNKFSIAKHLGGQSTGDNLKSLYIKTVYFKFGEFYFKYKNHKLRFLKLYREIINSILFMILFILTFQFRSFFKSLFTLIGILKFIYFMITN